MSKKAIMDSEILERILLLQNTLQIAPDEKCLSETVVRGLASLSCITECVVCVKGMITKMDDNSDIADFDVQSDICELWNNECINTCYYAKLKGWQKFELQTINNKYGAIFISFEDTFVFEPYMGFISNTANFIALHIENKNTLNELKAENTKLNSNVKQKLKNAILQNKQKVNELHELNKNFEEEQSAALNLMEDLSQEIRERKRTEQTLIESKEQLKASEVNYRSLFNSNRDSIVVAKINREIVNANKSLLDSFGYSLNELVGEQTDYIYESKEEYEEVGLIIKNNLKHQNSFVHKIKYKKKDGTTFIGETLLFYLKDDDGNTFGFVGLIRDVTQKMLAEAELENYRKGLESLVEMRTAELYDTNKKLEKEIIKKDEAEKKVSNALLKEQELNKIKDQFMSTVSHDLRTPLTAIQSSVELMERLYEKWDKEMVIKKYGQIKSSVTRITEMLNHVLELSRIERGKIKINYELVNLKNEFQTIIDEISLLKNQNHILKYNYKLDKEEHKVDIGLLREILTNLLTNGIKYSPDGGIVELLIEQEDKWLILQVCDEGMGISKNEIGSIFNEFYRTDGSQNISGSGLGLSIVKHYVEMYNGKIEVESKLGEGSVFRVKIPQSDS